MQKLTFIHTVMCGACKGPLCQPWGRKGARRFIAMVHFYVSQRGVKGCCIYGLICISGVATACQDSSEDTQHVLAVQRAVACKLFN